MPTQEHRSEPSSDSTAPNEPQWTTGQGIGFLVSLGGWLMAALGLVGLAVGVYAELDGAVLGVLGASTGAGVILAIPGTVVFNKCKRPEA